MYVDDYLAILQVFHLFIYFYFIYLLAQVTYKASAAIANQLPGQ